MKDLVSVHLVSATLVLLFGGLSMFAQDPSITTGPPIVNVVDSASEKDTDELPAAKQITVRNHPIKDEVDYSSKVFNTQVPDPDKRKIKDDVVILKNGDRMTGEIKGLAFGVLKFKASYMAESVNIDWFAVERLESNNKFLIGLVNGEQFSEPIAVKPSNGDPANVKIGSGTDGKKVNQSDVVAITRTESGFWRKLEGSINLGLSFGNGNGQLSTQISTDATYRRRDQSFTAIFDFSFTGQKNAKNNERIGATFGYEKQLKKKLYYGGFLDILKSNTQSLDLRTTVGGLFGRNLIRSPRTRLSVYGGLAVYRERYSGIFEQTKSTNADFVSGLNFRTFKFKKMDVQTSLSVFPSLTVPGRLRLQTRSNVRFDITGDFTFGVQLYDNFDSKPPINGTKNDFGINASVGWKFSP